MNLDTNRYSPNLSDKRVLGYKSFAEALYRLRPLTLCSGHVHSCAPSLSIKESLARLSCRAFFVDFGKVYKVGTYIPTVPGSQAYIGFLVLALRVGLNPASPKPAIIITTHQRTPKTEDGQDSSLVVERPLYQMLFPFSRRSLGYVLRRIYPSPLYEIEE